VVPGVIAENSAMSRYLSDLLRHLDRLSPQEWFVVLAIAVAIGALCLRGFGSRSQY
jgi:hypothetical protein